PRLFTLTIRNVSGLCQSRKPFGIVPRLLIAGLCLGKICFGGGHLGLSLMHASLGIEAGLINREARLLELLVQNCDLLLGVSYSRAGLLGRGLCLLLSGRSLFVVQDCDDIPGLYHIAFPHANVADATRS